MRVTQIWRYPVKSMAGEQLSAAEAIATGLAGDRGWALFDVESGLGLTARRSPELLFASASCQDDGTVQITLPDGTRAEDDAALSRWLGRPVELRSSERGGPRTYENPSDFEDEREPWGRFSGSAGAFHDSAEATISLLSEATAGSWDVRRFRANLLLDRGDETELVGHHVRVGGAELVVGPGLVRCVMVTRPQPDGIAKDLDVLRRIHRERGGDLAVGAAAVTSGAIAVGDELVRIPAR